MSLAATSVARATAQSQSQSQSDATSWQATTALDRHTGEQELSHLPSNRTAATITCLPVYDDHGSTSFSPTLLLSYSPTLLLSFSPSLLLSFSPSLLLLCCDGMEEKKRKTAKSRAELEVHRLFRFSFRFLLFLFLLSFIPLPSRSQSHLIQPSSNPHPTLVTSRQPSSNLVLVRDWCSVVIVL
jgi:hypothetical protein